MLLAEDFRAKAREALANRWGLAIGATFVAGLLGAEVSFGSNNFNYRVNENDKNNFLNSDLIKPYLPIIFTVSTILLCILLIHFFISGAADIGYRRFCLDLVDGGTVSFNRIFSGFSILWKAFCLRLLMNVKTFLWSLLFIIPGIIAYYRYSQAPYIMAEDTEVGISEAIERSKEMMDGNKWRLFCLGFSFIGWSILCIFTLGIGYLWLAPYESAAKAAFYREISGTWKIQQDAQPEFTQNNYYQ